jgi:octanoyl-[GcvH]:protein N-octanoyltransferase
MTVDLLEGGIGRDPALDLALAQALLTSVAQARRGPVLRVYRPQPTVAFGRRDAFLPGFARAAAAARSQGFTPAVRSAGGRAAAYDEGCVVLEEIMPAGDAGIGIRERFAIEAERQAQALRRLGVNARVGEVPGEYCPGEFTVNARGERKLIGTAQRIVRGGWMFSTVVVVASADRLRGVLDEVYTALELDWDPVTVGAVADEAAGASVDAVRRVLLDSYAERYDLVPAVVSPEELAAGAALLERHRVAV